MHAESTCWLERPLGCILVVLYVLPAGGAVGSYVVLSWGMLTSILPSEHAPAGASRATCVHAAVRTWNIRQTAWMLS